MITSCKTDVTTKSTFIQFVFAQFPEHLHEHVEHELLYHFEELEQGRMTLQEFAESVRASAVIREDELAQNVANKAIFEGVQTLIDQCMTSDNLNNSRPLDVHVWSNYRSSDDDALYW